jgi:hypothetical protein
MKAILLKLQKTAASKRAKKRQRLVNNIDKDVKGFAAFFQKKKKEMAAVLYEKIDPENVTRQLNFLSCT